MADTLVALAHIILNGVTSIQKKCNEEGTAFPSLDEQFTVQTEAARRQFMPEVIPVMAAAHQLLASLQAPGPYTAQTTRGGHIVAALDVSVRGHVPEILREAGPEGAHARDIAARNGIDEKKLARVLRMLATHHIFKEVSPGIFANNRHSSALDTGKPVSEILAKPEDKWDNTSGSGALVELFAGDSLRVAAHASDQIVDPKTTHSQEVRETAFNRAFNTQETFWEFYSRPENTYRLKRFNIAMKGSTAYGDPTEVLRGFEWEKLPKGAVVVDVGGGLGSTTQTIFDAHNHLQYIVQDRASVIDNAKEFWQASRPDALANGKVQLQVHNFFDAQPVPKASVYLLRAILHDWPDHHNAKILKHLLDVAGPDTKLIIMDKIVQFACTQEGEFENIPGTEFDNAPAPLLANYGYSKCMQYSADFEMLNEFNGQERTLSDFLELLTSVGWKIERVCGLKTDNWPRLVAVPA
ncbi:hypothetical protein CERSUDRAFT_114284 [Gelatoporia subvermispora B]|uniref:O-methyltransferase C-terminal domain-containing protein n=1 Tax=Ceriporiopsis subvermispora (strain B) TaxID=914234 RepID=M2PMK9_CERS8|nr:hypothetical protein CERSUDRAFT_114284 [Gelatoporia subvermispora B]